MSAAATAGRLEARRPTKGKRGAPESAGRGGGARVVAARLLKRLADSLHTPTPLRPGQVGGRCSLEELLRAYLMHGHDGPGAALYLVDLGELRQAFGGEWALVGRRLMGMVARAVAEALPAGDRFTQHGQDRLLLMVVERHVGAGRQTLRAVVDRIQARAFGNQPGRGTPCGVALRRVTLSELLGSASATAIAAPRAVPAGTDAPATDGIAAPKLTAAQLAERIHRQIAFAYRPVWAPRAQTVDTFLCLAERRADYGRFTGKWVLNGGYDDPFSFGVDLRSIDTVIGQLQCMRSLPRSVQVVLPLHFRNLVGGNADKILRLIAQGPAREDRHRLVFEIVGPLETLPLGRLPHVAGALRKAGAAVFVRSLPGRLDDLLRHLHGVDAVGLDLNDLSRNDPDPAQRARVLDDFAMALRRNAKALPPQSYLWDVRTTGEARAAWEGGLTLMAGPALRPDVEAPRAPMPLSWREFAG